jgi:hypothetical protein
MDQGAGAISLSIDKASFTFEVPGWLRERDAEIQLIEGVVSSRDDLTQTSCLPANTRQLVIRSNIPSISYNSEARGTDYILSSAVYPTGDLINSISLCTPKNMGKVTLPPQITIERLVYDQTTGILKPASAFNVEFKLVPMSFTFLITFGDNWGKALG